MATSPTLTCAQCGYVNEAERVYCHNCGSKLDRSLLPKESQRKGDSAESTRKRVKRMTNPGGSPVTRELKTMAGVVFWAAIVAALILIVLRPENVPGKAQPPARIVSSDLMAAQQIPRPVRLSFNENDINSFLSSVKSKTKGWIPGIDFKRAYVQLEPGIVRIGMEQSAWGYSIFSSVDEKIGVTDGVFWSKPVGGRFGRLSIHPVLMEYADVAFQNLWKALDRQHKQMDRMEVITVEKGKIVLQTKGGVQEP